MSTVNPHQNGLGAASLPHHIAIIMDGNGRWAKRKHLPRTAGHHAGVESVRLVVEACAKRGIEVLTLFAFGKENWQRPVQEVGYLMELFLKALESEVKKLHQNNVKLQFIGDCSALSDKLKTSMAQSNALTASNTGLVLNIAVDYSGRWDILQASKRLAKQVEAGQLKADTISSADFEQYLCLHGLPEPDLFIRTSGEQRISNFLLWQLAYTELYFTDVLWPDLTEEIIEEALIFYSNRQRRFGFTGEQMESQQSA
jgi:undecaprenyl diphosphate synthase